MAAVGIIVAVTVISIAAVGFLILDAYLMKKERTKNEEEGSNSNTRDSGYNRVYFSYPLY